MNLIRFNHQPRYAGLPSLLSSFFNEFDSELLEKGEYGLPSTNILEKDHSYHLEVALPGIDKKDVTIDLDKHVLTITSKAKEEKQEESQHFTRREFGYRSYKRSFTLPEDAHMEKIRAAFQNGVLHIEIPKLSDEKLSAKKQIAIG